MSIMQSLLAVTSGGIVGLSLGLLGGGGSILAVPLLLYLVKLKDPHVVIGTSALAVSVNAYVNLVAHARTGHVRWRPAVLFALPGVAGAAIGSIVGKSLHGSTLLFLFALLMLIIAGMMAFRIKSPEKARVPQPEGQAVLMENAPPQNMTTWSLIKILTAGFLVGALSGFFGIGGGFLIVPALILSTNMTLIEAIGTSLFAVGTFGLTTAVTYSLAGLINWLAFLEFVAGGALGGFVGVRIAGRLSRQRKALNYVFSGVLLVVALYMLYRNAMALHL